MSTLTYARVEEELRGRARFGPELGLERTIALLAAAGARTSWPVGAQVAGTNGKGSVVALLEAAGTGLGSRSGAYTSPHLQSYRERIRWMGRPLAASSFAAVLAQALEAEHRCRERLGAATEFELLTVGALRAFTERQAGWVVLEVGLGGRLDATSGVGVPMAVITQLGRDHVRILGRRVQDIAAEKAAIIRPGQLVVSSARGVAGQVVEGRAAEAGAVLWRLGREVRASVLRSDWSGVEAEVHTPLGGPWRLRSPLRGQHQAANLAVAAAAARGLAELAGLDWKEKDAAAAMAAARWPGRMELVETASVPILLDGAHNPSGASALVASLSRLLPLPLAGSGRPVDGPVHLVLAMLRDKEAGPVSRALARLRPARVWLPAITEPRGRDPRDLKRWWPQARLSDGVPQALAAAQPGAGMVLVCGTLSLVGEARSALGLPPA